MSLKTAKYFIDTMEYLPDYFNNGVPKEDLEYDLNNIDDDFAIKLFKENKPSNWNILCSLYDEGDRLLLWKKCILLEKIKDENESLFVKKLTGTNDPYDDEELININVDSEGLVNLKEFAQYQIENNLKGKYCLCLPIRTNRFYNQVKLSLFDLRNDGNAEIKIRLDPLIKHSHIPTDFEKIFGKKLNWNELAKVNENVPVLFQDFDSNVKTQIYWERRDNELHFNCEELPLFEEVHRRGSRYYHAVYDTEMKMITHFDASTKIYSEEEILKRYDLKLWDKKCKTFKRYYKIYKINGIFSTGLFTNMIISFFIGNEDVKGYFKELAGTGL